jgi:hypothetical protein
MLIITDNLGYAAYKFQGVSNGHCYLTCNSGGNIDISVFLESQHFRGKVDCIAQSTAAMAIEEGRYSTNLSSVIQSEDDVSGEKYMNKLEHTHTYIYSLLCSSPLIAHKSNSVVRE